MSTPKQRIDQVLDRWVARSVRAKIAPNMHIIGSSFSNSDDGLTVTYQYAGNLRHNTLMTFQAVDNTRRYSLFIGPVLSIKELQDSLSFLQREIILPLTEGQWNIDITALPELLLCNQFNESIPVKGGRRIWNTTLPQECVATAQWYNPRQPLLSTPEPLILNNAPIISGLATQVGHGSQRNLDGDFSPDAAFTSEEVA